MMVIISSVLNANMPPLGEGGVLNNEHNKESV